MRPLPRLLAFVDDRIGALDDLGVRAAAVAAAGPAAGLVARLPRGSTDRLAALAQRFVALAAPPMASVFVTGRADLALAVGAHGVILRNGDLDVATVRALLHGEHREGSARPVAIPRFIRDDTRIFRSVHTVTEAELAVAEGADALIVGSIWPSASHPDRAPAGTGLLSDVVSLGLPTYAIGGVTVARATEAHAAGAWGVAAITAVWDVAEPYQAAMAMVRPWIGAS